MGSAFLNFVLRCSLLPKMDCFCSIFVLQKKIHGNCIFLAKGCIVAPNSRKQTPLKIRFYFQTNINQPINTFFKSWQWHQFNIGLTITLFCFVTCNFLPNFIIALTHSIFNIKSSVIPLDEMSHCVEKDAQVKILI